MNVPASKSSLVDSHVATLQSDLEALSYILHDKIEAIIEKGYQEGSSLNEINEEIQMLLSHDGEITIRKSVKENKAGKEGRANL